MGYIKNNNVPQLRLCYPVLLFGSIARDEVRSTSDIDILMEFQGTATFGQNMKLKFFLEDRLACSVDLVTPKALKPRVKPYIEKEALYVT